MTRMTKRTLFITLGAAILAALPLAAPAQAPVPAARTVTLRYKFTPGQVHRYKVTMNTAGTMTTGKPGADYPLNSASQVVIKQTVKDVRATDGAATFVTEIESTRFAMNGKEQTLSEAQQAAMKKPFTQVMLPTGKILSATLPDTLGMLTPGIDFGKSFSSLRVAFPDGSLKPSESWKATAALPDTEGSSLSYDSTLTSLTGDGAIARANIDQKISSSLVSGPSQGSSKETGMEVTILGTGTMVFDTALGAVQSLTNDSSTNMTLPLVKMQVRQKTTMELLPDVAAAPTK